MDDLEIIKDREGKYGPPPEFFERYGQICEILDGYANHNNSTPNAGHLAALKMVALKMLLSAWNPGVEDNYCDGRNYFTIAEMVGISAPDIREKMGKL